MFIIYTVLDILDKQYFHTCYTLMFGYIDIFTHWYIDVLVYEYIDMWKMDALTNKHIDGSVL